MFVYVCFVLCLWSDWFCRLTWQRVYIQKRSFQMCICLSAEFDCPEVTLCGWQDIMIQINFLLPQCASLTRVGYRGHKRKVLSAMSPELSRLHFLCKDMNDSHQTQTEWCQNCGPAYGIKQNSSRSSSNLGSYREHWYSVVVVVVVFPCRQTILAWHFLTVSPWKSMSPTSADILA